MREPTAFAKHFLSYVTDGRVQPDDIVSATVEQVPLAAAVYMPGTLLRVHIAAPGPHIGDINAAAAIAQRLPRGTVLDFWLSKSEKEARAPLAPHAEFLARAGVTHYWADKTTLVFLWRGQATAFPSDAQAIEILYAELRALASAGAAAMEVAPPASPPAMVPSMQLPTAPHAPPAAQPSTALSPPGAAPLVPPAPHAQLAPHAPHAPASPKTMAYRADLAQAAFGRQQAEWAALSARQEVAALIAMTQDLSQKVVALQAELAARPPAVRRLEFPATAGAALGGGCAAGGSSEGAAAAALAAAAGAPPDAAAAAASASAAAATAAAAVAAAADVLAGGAAAGPSNASA